MDKGTDEWIVHQSDVDFRVTTTPAEIRGFMERDDEGVKLVFSTYQSAEVVAKAIAGLPAFDIGVFDEAHKTAGREGMKFSLALQDKNLPIRKRLFLTATPRHYKVVISMVTSEMVNEAQRRRSVVVVDGEEVKAQLVS